MTQSRLMQTFRIFGAREGIYFEFTIFTWFGKFGKRLNWWSPPVSGRSEQRCLDHARRIPLPHCRAHGFAPLPHVHPNSAATIAVAPRFPLPIKRPRGRGEFPPFPFLIPHRSAPALPPLCDGKPSPMRSQVECLSHHRLEPQLRAKLTPVRSSQGHQTPRSSSPQAATGAVFHRSFPGPNDLSMSITESQSPSMTTLPPTYGVSPVAHRCAPYT
jgi:hypothetical protein